MNEQDQNPEKDLAEAHKAASMKSDQVQMDSAEGKVALDKLLKSLPEGEAKKLQEALDSEEKPHIHIDENNNVFIGKAADEAVELRKKGGKLRPPTKIDEKRARIFEDRVKRWMGKNDGKTREDAIHALHAEDFAALPIEKKLEMVQQVTYNAHNQLAGDFVNLERNQFALAESMDINFRGMSKLFIKLGVSVEDYNKIMGEARDEVREAHQKTLNDRREVAHKQQLAAIEASEKKSMVGEAKEVAAEPGKEAKGAELPKDATVFGG